MLPLPRPLAGGRHFLPQIARVRFHQLAYGNHDNVYPVCKSALSCALLRPRHVLAQAPGTSSPVTSLSASVPNASTLPAQSGSEALLAEREEARPADAAPVTPALRSAFTHFVAEVLSDTQETNLVRTDVQEVLSEAAGLTIGRAEASGPNRVQQTLREAYLNTQFVGPRTARKSQILLYKYSAKSNQAVLSGMRLGI